MRPQRQQPTRLPRPWDSPGKNTGVGCHFLLQCRKVKSESEVAQLCPILSDPMDCSLPGSSVHGIVQARVLEWGATAFSDVASGPPLTRSLLLLTFCMNYCVMFVTTVLHLFIPFPSEPWGIHQSLPCPYTSVFSRMSYSGIQNVAFQTSFLPFFPRNMHFRFLHVSPWLDSFYYFLICSLVFDFLDSSTGMNLEECIVHFSF